MAGELIILGCGASAGVPAIGNWWGNCDAAEPRNRRTRASAAIKTATTLVIIDTGPDFREQINRENLGTPDAILITHGHFDHINGLDELRTLQRLKKRTFPVYADQPTMDQLMIRMDYMFKSSEDGFYATVCESVIVQEGQILSIGDLELKIFGQQHGSIRCLGIRIGDIAYSTDLKYIAPETLNDLNGIHTWVVDAAGHHSPSNPVHASIGEVIEMNKRVGAKRVILTHLPPTMDYMTLCNELPEGFEPAYDGMRFQID